MPIKRVKAPKTNRQVRITSVSFTESELKVTYAALVAFKAANPKTHRRVVKKFRDALLDTLLSK